MSKKEKQDPQCDEESSKAIAIESSTKHYVRCWDIIIARHIDTSSYNNIYSINTNNKADHLEDCDSSCILIVSWLLW